MCSPVEGVQQFQKGQWRDTLQSGDPPLAEEALSPQNAPSLTYVDPKLEKGT